MHLAHHKVEAILKEAQRFVVPLYQRKYQWDDERLTSFLEDLEAKAIEVLHKESKFEHYMGALILSPIETSSHIGRTPVVQVVDGQQRLTTFQFFLAALREVARDYELTDIMEHVKAYLENDPKSKEKNEPLAKFKLTPTPSDRDLFHDLIEMDSSAVANKYKKRFHGKGVPKNTPWPALRAYWSFYVWIQDFCKVLPSDECVNDKYELEESHDSVSEKTNKNSDIEFVEQRLEALLSAILDRLKLVVITLDENDDAQVIFETLNSKGKPLLAMDLVRNNVFHRAEKQKVAVEELYKKLWDPLDNTWWRKSAPNARPHRPRIDHFLGHVLAAETGASISMRELYAEYRDFAVPKGKPRFADIEDELRLLERYAPLYETLEGRLTTDPSLAWFGKKMKAWQVTTVYPVALQLGQADIEPKMRDLILKLLYSYIARRSICGLTTKNLNKTFQGLASDFKTSGVNIETFKSYFSSKEGDSTRFPNDDELHKGILKNNAYRIAPRARLVDILWEFEKASRSPKGEASGRSDDLWVEHILPQRWTEEWPFAEGEFVGCNSSEPKADVRRDKLDTFGNLTLLTRELNQSVGNKNLKAKQKEFEKHTGLFLNKWFKDLERWTEKEIEERGDHLASLAKCIWPTL